LKVTRWDVERAALASGLPSTSRYRMLVLCTRCDGGSATIPAKYQPSLTRLVRLSGLARSTVCIHLRILERRGWLIRHRPTARDARTKHHRTHYTLRIPELVRSVDGPPSPEDGSELVRPPSKAGPDGGRTSSLSTHSSSAARSEEDDAHQMTPKEVAVVLKITETLRDVAPRNAAAHTPDWARKVAQSIEGGTRNRPAYVETVIRANPSAYLPTPEPPRFRAPRRDTT
jgi:DNA-binding MarR family transcriptional regulator